MANLEPYSLLKKAVPSSLRMALTAMARSDGSFGRTHLESKLNTAYLKISLLEQLLLESGQYSQQLEAYSKATSTSRFMKSPEVSLMQEDNGSKNLKASLFAYVDRLMLVLMQSNHFHKPIKD